RALARGDRGDDGDDRHGREGSARARARQAARGRERACGAGRGGARRSRPLRGAVQLARLGRPARARGGRLPARSRVAIAAVRERGAEEWRLDLVSKTQRPGKAVGMYFLRCEREDVTLRVIRLEGRLALAAHLAGAAAPAYFILLEWEAGRVRAIRDFRYVPY